jgi:transglutaminase-like putative cysteine protease
MFAGKSGKRVVGVVVALMLVVCTAVLSLSEVLMPEASGTKVLKDNKITVDASHADQGYVMVKGPKSSKKKLKVRVETGGTYLNYNLNQEGNFEVFPLQLGRTNYSITLYLQKDGNKYGAVGKVKVAANMSDELSCFLYPNQYVNYTADSPCVKKASELCKGMSDQAEIYKAVCNFIKTNFVYDFIKSVTVAGSSGMLPDIDYCWNNKMGICQDLSALTCAMLRSQGVPARLVIGTLGSGTPHAWVMAVVNGEDAFFDPTAELNATSKADTYTTERWY